MQFIVEYALAPDSEASMAEHKIAHLEYRMGLQSLRLAAQILSEERGMIGSILIIDATDRDDARRVALADPYHVHGVYLSATIRPCDVRFCDLSAGPTS